MNNLIVDRGAQAAGITSISLKCRLDTHLLDPSFGNYWKKCGRKFVLERRRWNWKSTPKDGSSRWVSSRHLRDIEVIPAACAPRSTMRLFMEFHPSGFLQMAIS